MLNNLKQINVQNRTVFGILALGLMIQLITGYTQIGVSSADQHFQIVEFSLYQLDQPNGAIQVWEIENFVRSTIQVYLFTGFHQLCNLLGITDPYHQLTIVRLVLGAIMWWVFNAMVFHYFGKSSRNIFLAVLLLINFSWVLPYTRTLFSSEMMGSLFFFGALLLYERNKEKSNAVSVMLLTGFLFCLAFYFRFQMAFGMLGIGIWILFFERRYKHLLFLAAGFAVGFVLNTWLDHQFYQEWVITPYEYFYANIIDGRADQFGRSSFLRYIGLILLVTPAPLFSIVLFIYLLKTSFKQYYNPIVLSTVLFVLFHSLVGHKEERFLFPVFNVFPLFIGFAIPDVQRLFNSGRKWLGAFMSLLLGTSLFINTLLLLVMAVVPYSQTILFSKKLSGKFRGQQVTLFCIRQTPFETPSGNQMEFYKKASKNLSLEKIDRFNLATLEWAKPKYLAVSYNDVKNNFADLERLGYKPVMASSDLLWNINNFLKSRNLNTINEIWMLYAR